MAKNFNEHTMAVFSAMNTDYEAISNLMTDVALGREIYDAETDRKITKQEANARILDFSRQVLGITDIHDTKAVRRAIRDNARQWFDIVEDTINIVIDTNFKESDFFNALVDRKQIAFGDRQDFVIEDDDALFSIAKAGTSHHDHILQRLKGRQTISIPTELYVVKIGADINRYVLGDVDWSKWVANIGRSFVAMIQEETYAELIQAVTSLPGRFKGTGTLDATTKASFDDIVQAVSAANNGANVVIMGAKAALSKISGLADVNWAAKDQRDNVMNTGNIGIYEGTTLLEIPNRFKDKTYSQYVFDTDKLYIIPVIGDEGKFIKMVDEGDTEIFEVLERNEKYVSDLQTYEVQRRLGFGLYIGRMFGYWDI
ncbi:hypothetical protein SAMN05660484_02243 [Eubacterium ruminantium]|uniref:Uncharacterized protein n=1 Tax=Eubacterium ruminantium TaxID=42322 RepID=A0A1T4Q379_9FIRM|nr:hypothetical protein [Eubacterium ruminantium]SCW64374.1 hypothetical protein SAMN05660484_02243 [Eubacterium ruminantium]SDN30044.1 hypothetical protein SAMN04490370_11627 [Eubacterium ruminantium]SJZ98285.1 hypothetical protein SAMN02745110_02240 [Eubacterium ruminantium]